jgi:hypothetical protein
MPTGVKLSKSWRNLSAALKPGAFTKKLEREVGKATALNGMLVAREMRTAIKGGVAPANAPLTIDIKGSTKPLIDKADLWKAITSVKANWKTGFAGLLRGRKGADGHLINIGEKLHEGFTMRVTPAMRGLFQALAQASRSGDPKHLTGRAQELWARTKGKVAWAALKPETTAIIVKGRPWINIALGQPGLKAKLKKNWEDAVQRTISPKGA